MGALFGGGVPKPPKQPSPDEIRQEELVKKAAENQALRDSLFERKIQMASRGRSSMINSGLGIPT
jgi:hypothetical protein